MHFSKVLPIVPFSKFMVQAARVREFAGQAGTAYSVDRIEGNTLCFRRLHAKNKERIQRLDLRELYRALRELDDFATKNFRDFIPGTHSPGRAFLVHLGLIISAGAKPLIFFIQAG
jgi:hypothetical protein